MTFVRKKSNVNIVDIPINPVKFERHLVRTIDISSGMLKFTSLRPLLSALFSGSEDSWFYIWKTEPNSTVNPNGNSSANAKLTRKQRRHFDRAFERIRGKIFPGLCKNHMMIF